MPRYTVQARETEMDTSVFISRNPTILVVDDDPAIPMLVRMAIQRKLPHVRALTASNGEEGLDLLRKNRVHLLITDLSMPVMDGITFLCHVMEEFPHLPRVVLTSLGSDSKEYAKQTGVSAVLAKPIDMTLLTANVERWLSELRPHSFLENLSLATFVQLVALDRRTCSMGVREIESGKIGLLFFREGRIVGASAGRLTGEEAALEMLSWSEVQVWLYNFQPDTPETIRAPLQRLILEAAKRRDERAERGEKRSSHPAVPTPAELREGRPAEVTAAVFPPVPPRRKKPVPKGKDDAEPARATGTAAGKDTPSEPVSDRPLNLLIDDAVAAFRARDYGRAKELWKEAGRRSPDNPVVRHNLALVERLLRREGAGGEHERKR